MALLCSRIFTQRQLAGCLFRGITNPQLKSTILRTAGSALPRPGEDFDAKNARLGRPQSPHLTIYSLQLTSVMSVTHRGTGMAMGGIVMLWGISGLFMSGSFPQTIAALQDLHLPGWFLFIVKLGLAFPLAYHYCNGIRHLSWDMGKFLTIKEVYTTGYAVVAVASVAAVALASL